MDEKNVVKFTTFQAEKTRKWYNTMQMKDIIDDYLGGEIIDPTLYDAYDIERLDDFLGDNDETDGD